ncbi:helix-turn-helix domain-containing protein [bacterium]|nr:helix-turn-helix domain-containing protein [bacterium]
MENIKCSNCKKQINPIILSTGWEIEPCNCILSNNKIIEVSGIDGIELLGDSLIKLRKNKDVSMREAAKGIGILTIYLSELEAGLKIPTAYTLEKIATYYINEIKDLINEYKKIISE